MNVNFACGNKSLTGKQSVLSYQKEKTLDNKNKGIIMQYFSAASQFGENLAKGIFLLSPKTTDSKDQHAKVITTLV